MPQLPPKAKHIGNSYALCSNQTGQNSCIFDFSKVGCVSIKLENQLFEAEQEQVEETEQ